MSRNRSRSFGSSSEGPVGGGALPGGQAVVGLPDKGSGRGCGGWPVQGGDAGAVACDAAGAVACDAAGALDRGGQPRTLRAAPDRAGPGAQRRMLSAADRKATSRGLLAEDLLAGGDRGTDRAGPERGLPRDRPPRRPQPLPRHPRGYAPPRLRPGRRPKARKLDTDPRLRTEVIARLRAGYSPNQVAGRLRDEHPAEQARWVSHEAMSTPGSTRCPRRAGPPGILLRSRADRPSPPRAHPRTGRPTWAMRSIDDRPTEATDRRVPGHWEGDLLIGRAGRGAMATLVERTSRYTVPVALPAGRRDATTTCDALIDAVAGMPSQLRKTLTWDQAGLGFPS